MTEMTEQELRAVTGTIFNIQHYCIHDGPGIRTNVFVKGCPLRCLWCANPESQVLTPQLMYHADKCVGCGACIAACPNGAIMYNEITHKVYTDRALCTGCGACVKVCPQEAREIIGQTVTAGEVFDEVESDALFYGDDGGITVTGGEALAHPKFTYALLKLCKLHGIKTAVETCGAVSWETMQPCVSLCDVVLYDNKHMDSAKHKEYTGQPNERILENLKRIDAETDAEIWVRVPTIPGVNDSEENISAVGRFVAENLHHCTQVHLLPAHRLGIGKAEQLERADIFDFTVPDAEHMESLRDIIRGYGIVCK